MIISRDIENTIGEVVSKIPVIVITGPRQSGKTTLAKKLFSHYRYVNFEFPDERERATNDPRTLLKDTDKGIILDEIQRVPSLLSYVQGITDERKLNGHIILAGSQNMNLLESVTQSLAGRTINFTLLPFSISELKNAGLLNDRYAAVFKGFYPRLFDMDLSPASLYPSYIQSYVERDVRQLLNVRDLDKFQLFIKLLAGRIGQPVNYSSLSAETGVDAKTIRTWISILEACFIVFHVRPYYKNYNKRPVKSSKLYFYDTGLACSLPGINNTDQLQTHYLFGGLFENMVVADCMKQLFNSAVPGNLYFWQDSTKNEVDCIYEQANDLTIMEIKSSQTFHNSFLKNLDLFMKLENQKVLKPVLVYGGNESFSYNNVSVTAWDQPVLVSRN